MKPSHYNYWIEREDGKSLCYNMLSSGFALMNENSYNFFLKVANNQIDIGNMSDEEKKLYEEFKKGNFIVEEHVDEMSSMRINHYKANYNTSGLGFTILPTLRCNLNCSYCFEQNKNIDMDDDVSKAIKEYTQKNFDARKISFVGVNWFGGEPLLQMDRICELSDFFMEITKKNDAGYSAEMISNCYVLTDEIAKKLSDRHVNSIQVTIDGPRQLHDSKRITPDGKGSFDRIIENTLVGSQHTRMIVRINMDNDVAERMDEMFADLEPLKDKPNIDLYMGLLKADVTSVCSSIKNKCIDVKNYANLYYEFYRKCYDSGFGLSWFPTSTPGSCCATSVCAMVIDPNGNLCRCWSQVGEPAESYGNIVKERNKFRGENYYKWILHDPYANQECLKCTFLPLCNSGCPATRVPATTEYMKPNFDRTNKCTPEKYNLKKMLGLLYDIKVQESQNQSRDNAGIRN
jgi:uncharacterized protein